MTNLHLPLANNWLLNKKNHCSNDKLTFYMMQYFHSSIILCMTRSNKYKVLTKCNRTSTLVPRNIYDIS